MMKRLFVMLKAKEVKAQIAVTDIADEFYEDFATEETGRYWWWIRMILLDPNELIVDDGYDNLFRVSWAVGTGADEDAADGDTPIVFGEPTPIKIQYVDVSAKAEATYAACSGIASVRGQEKVAASYKSRAESRPDQGGPMREYIEKLRAKLGLAKDATDEQVLAAASVKLEAEPEVEKPDDTEPEKPEVEKPDDTEPEEPVKPATEAKTVSAEALEDLKKDAALGRAAREEQLQVKAEAEVDKHITEGAIPPRTRASYLSQILADDKAGRNDTREFLKSLDRNVVPVEARGGSSKETVTDRPDLDLYLAAYMPDIAAKKARILSGNTDRILTDA